MWLYMYVCMLNEHISPSISINSVNPVFLRYAETVLEKM